MAGMVADGREAMVDGGDGMLDTIMEEVTDFVFSVPDFGPGDALSVPAPDGARLKLRLPQNAMPGDRMYMGKNEKGDWVIKRVARPQTQTITREDQIEGLDEGDAGADAAASSGLPDELFCRSPDAAFRSPETSSMKDDKSDPDCVTIMCLGDSFTHGWHIPGGYRIHLWELFQRAGWKVRFAGSLKNGPKGIDRRHEGWPGYRIDELMNGRGEEVDINLQRDLCRHRPDIVLLLVGTNDVIDDIELENAGHRFVALLDTIQAQLPDVKVVFGNLPHIRGMEAGVDQVNMQLLEAARAANVCGLFTRLLDINSLLGPRDFHDSVHLNVRGFNKLARGFFKILEEQDIVPPEARPIPQQEQPSPPAARRKVPAATRPPSPGRDALPSRSPKDTSASPSKEAAKRRLPQPGNASPRSGGAGLVLGPGAAVAGSTSPRAPSPRRTSSPRRATGSHTPPMPEVPSARPVSPRRGQSEAVSPSLRLSSMLSAGSDAGPPQFGHASGHANAAAQRQNMAVRPPGPDNSSVAAGGSKVPGSPRLAPSQPQVNQPHDNLRPGVAAEYEDGGNAQASSHRGQLTPPGSGDLHGLLPVGGEAAKRRELAIREDILRRVQQLQLRSGALGRPAPTDSAATQTRGEAPGRPATGKEMLVEWDAGYEEGELGCVIN